MFESEVYTIRRTLLREAVGSGLLLFMGHTGAPRNYCDNTYPFRQDSSFLYYFGHSMPGLAGVIDAWSGREWLFGHTFSMDEMIWTGPRPDVQALGEDVGVENGRDIHGLFAFLEQARRKGRQIHFLPPYRGDTRIALHELLDMDLSAVDSGASPSLMDAVIAQRSVKSEDEVAEIESALDISGAMYSKAFDLAMPGRTEQEVAGRIEGEVLARGSRLSFASIVTVHGEVLHNHRAHETLKQGDLLLIDSGAESANGYASDITRTIPVGGRFSSLQRDIYDIVLKAQERAIQSIAPGVFFKDVHRTAARIMVEGLCDLGIMRGDVDEAVAAGAHALFFVHGLGHMLGLDVHDMECLGEDRVGYNAEVSRSTQFGLSALRMARRVFPGHVLTVEPGLYFIPGLMNVWQKEGRCAQFIRYDKLEPFRTVGGIRIEDDILVTQTGARVLGAPILKKIKELEARMR